MSGDQGKQIIRHFNAAATLVRILGRELLPNDHIAIVELVKNAYDSNASSVTIHFIANKKGALTALEIVDDGEGMGLDEFDNIWLVAGYSEKQARKGQRRIPLGEKGIGRFASDKLGEKLKLTSARKEDKAAIVATFDWKDYEDKNRKWSEINVPVTYTDKGFLPNKSHGTHLLINELRTRWDSRRLKHLGRELQQLIIPAGPRGEFRIALKVDGHADLSRDIVASGEKSSDYVLSFSLNANGVVTKQLSRSARAASFSKLGRNEHFNATRRYPKSPFGPIKGILYYNAHDLKRSEADVAGVRIYRDGFRVEPYGGPDDDWLGIEKWKAARAGHAPLVPTQLAGYIEISRIENPSLLDTTNRHAIIENEAFEEFTKFAFEQVQALADIINREVKRPQWEAHKEAELQKASQESLEQIGVMAVGLVHELRQPLQTINTQCALLLELLSPTDRGKVKPNIDTILKSADRMDSTIKLLSSFSRGNYVDIKDLCPGDIMKQWGRHWTEEARKDGVAFHITDETEEAVLAFNENLLVSVGYILVQNAIHAAAQSQRKGEVSLTLRKSSSKTLTLTVQDNGPGIDPKVQKELFKRFYTNKPGGRGLGLFWVRKLLDLYNCLIDYKTGDDGTTFTVVIKSAKEE